MFALRVELLMGRAVMTRIDNRELPEWPPHPDRVFMALVAAWGESGEYPGPRAALEWLEAQGPPDLSVPLNYSRRTSFVSYVPVNDDSSPVGKKGSYGHLSTMPLCRNRQPRYFSTAVPESSTFYLSWNVAAPEMIRRSLDELNSFVTYLGHSSTPIRVSIVDNAPPATLVPSEDNIEYRLRVFGNGRLAYLKNRYEAGLRPNPSSWQNYAEPQTVDKNREIVDGPFDPGLLVFRFSNGRKFGLESCGILASAIRATLMSRHGDNPPEWLSGHAAEGVSRISRPAYLPLGFVEDEYADGHLVGMAIAIPSDFQHVEELMELLGRHDYPELDPGTPYMNLHVKNPHFGDETIGVCDLEWEDRPDGRRLVNLKNRSWTRPSRCWATVTPIVLPQFPRRHLSIDDVIRKACRDSGYPEPCQIRFGTAPMLSGVPHARSFHTKPQSGRPPRPLIHAEISFPQEVRGPVLIGSGRYSGFGIFRPIADRMDWE